MKKRYRNIIIDGISYSWSYKVNGDRYEGGGMLKIWKNKKIVFERWCHCDVIVTPSYIAELITGGKYE